MYLFFVCFVIQKEKYEGNIRRIWFLDVLLEYSMQKHGIKYLKLYEEKWYIGIHGSDSNNRTKNFFSRHTAVLYKMKQFNGGAIAWYFLFVVTLRVRVILFDAQRTFKAYHFVHNLHFESACKYKEQYFSSPQNENNPHHHRQQLCAPAHTFFIKRNLASFTMLWCKNIDIWYT